MVCVFDLAATMIEGLRHEVHHAEFDFRRALRNIGQLDVRRTAAPSVFDTEGTLST